MNIALLQDTGFGQEIARADQGTLDLRDCIATMGNPGRDGRHAHPWPVMECRLADRLQAGVPCLAAVGGVTLAVMDHPGMKVLRTGTCWNGAAITADVADLSSGRFVDTVLGCQTETPFAPCGALRAASRARANRHRAAA